MLGQALAQEFSGQEVLAWDKEEIDITDFEASRRKIVEARPAVIFNCAAFTDVDGCEDKPELAVQVNGEAVKNLAAAADDLGAVLVQFSSVYVFDGKRSEGYGEAAEPDPLSVYGESKLLGERAAGEAKKHYIIRLDRLFGKSGQGKKSFVDLMLEKAVYNAPHPPLKLRGGAKGSYSPAAIKVIADEYGCPTYAPDLARLVRRILEQNLPYGIYHCANSGSCSWFEQAEEIFKIRGIAVELKKAGSSDFSRKAQRPRFGILLNTKLPPQRPWQAALGEYLKFQARNPKS